LVMILFWRENKGDVNDDVKSIFSGIFHAGKVIYSSTEMMCLGLSQAFYEGAVYTFVFMWVPNMQLVAGSKAIPTGLIFSCFMLSMTLGGTLSGILLDAMPMGAGGVCLLVYLLGAVSMTVPILTYEFWPVFISFLVLEFSLGIFNAGGGTLRSKYYPDALQSSIMNVFRIPLNMLVVLGTKLTSYAGADVEMLQKVFGVVVCMHLAAFGFQLKLSMCQGRAGSTNSISAKSHAIGSSVNTTSNKKLANNKSISNRNLSEIPVSGQSTSSTKSSSHVHKKEKPALSPSKKAGRSTTPTGGPRKRK